MERNPFSGETQIKWPGSTRVAFEELFSRLPNYEISGLVVRACSSSVRGLAQLPTVLDPTG